MNLNEKLESFVNRNYEFDAELENHPLGNQTKYRLYYMKYYRKQDSAVGAIDWPFKVFMLPEGMNREDAFKVLSYLTDFIERKCELEPCSYKSVMLLDDVLNLERLGFKRVEEELEDNEVIDLFTVAGRVELFKRSKHYQKYFEWYIENVTFDEVKEIYQKCNIELTDLQEINNSFSHSQYVKKNEN